MIQHGLIIDEIIPNDHYIFGGYGSLKAKALNPSRDWQPFVPVSVEVQNLNDIEPQACSNFGTLNAVEIIIKILLNQDKDYSDRYFAKMSGTNPERGGNSPHLVAEYLRKRGVVDQQDWVFDGSIDTLEKFYSDIPLAVQRLARTFTDEFEFGHDWIPSDPKALYDALQYSPLGFSVYAWIKDENGLYYRPEGATDTHWCVCIYAEWGKYWLILDSYMDEGVLLKKVRWDALPMRAKRYSLAKKEAKQSKLSRIMAWLNELLESIVYGDLKPA